MKWSGNIALAQTGALGREYGNKQNMFSPVKHETWNISTISMGEVFGFYNVLFLADVLRVLMYEFTYDQPTPLKSDV